MKKYIAVLLMALLTLGCVAPGAMAEEEKIRIVATIFPVYDWARQVAGDRADLTLLLDSGVDLHSYQPTAQDILKISTADVFIYVGGESDEWVEDVLKTAMNPNIRTINLLEALGEDVKMEEIVEGMEHEHDHDEDEEEHDHEEDHDEDEHDHEDDHDEDHEEDDHDHEEDHDEEDHDHEEHDHEEEADEHVWLSLRNAQKLVQSIADVLAEINTAQADAYQTNAAAYRKKLEELDARYSEAVSQAKMKTILFGDRFPFRYLADDYGLTYYAAFSGCSAETEASFQTIVFLAQKVDELGLPAVLTIENPKTRIAETVVQATAAKDQKILSLDSMQSVTAKDIQNGATYLSIMESNLNVLLEALNK